MSASSSLAAPSAGLDALEISAVLPALNEAGNIGPLVLELRAALTPAILAEIIVVDDGSDDGTASEVKALLGNVEGLRYLRHASPCGQSAAVRTGVRAARSSLIATMDGDGQNDPRDIASLAERIAQESSDRPALAGGIRTTRRAEGSKRLASKFANWLRDAMLSDGCPDTGCGIKVFRRDAFLELPYFSGMHRYLPALFLTYGHRVTYVPVNDRPRRIGKSKYTNLGRALLGVYDLFGVHWLRRRTVVPIVAEPLGAPVSTASKPAPATRSAARGGSAEISNGRPLGV